MKNMTRIIGHRGAAGLALENSPESIKAALTQNIDAVECDVQRTLDGKLVVIHGKTTGRVAQANVRIADKTLAQLQTIPLKNGQRIPTLDQALSMLGSMPVIIDIKDEGSADELLAILAKHPHAQVSFASFKHGELARLAAARPDAPIYVLEHFSPIDIIRHAHSMQARGIGLNKWLMNPLTYYLAKHYGLELFVYTLNSRLLAWFFLKLYPSVNICTDHPERLRQ